MLSGREHAASGCRTRREFLYQIGAATAGLVAAPRLLAEPGEAPAARPDAPVPGKATRVIIARDETLTKGSVDEHAELLRKLLDAALQRLTDAPDAATAWRSFFKAGDRVALKVNTLGLSTQPAVADAIVAGLCAAGVRPENIIIWDRFDRELAAAGFKLNQSTDGVQCRGTDAERIGSGYAEEVEKSGEIGSCFSRILTGPVDAIISVPVFKDHGLAGVSLGMKNFYGAIHNPNKYHGNNCDPFVADVVAHRYIAPKWRLTICDGTRAQVQGGPGRSPQHAWSFGGLIISNDFVAADAVGADLLEQERHARGLKSLAEDRRPPKHIATAGARGLGQSDLNRIERIEV